MECSGRRHEPGWAATNHPRSENRSLQTFHLYRCLRPGLLDFGRSAAVISPPSVAARTAGEIVGQVMVARDRLGDWPGHEAPVGAAVPTDGGQFITNIVMMGMGEPLYNFEAVRDALLVVADNEGIGISKRKITV